ncbi:GDSL-type esterase/lipase family protein [Streptomyces sp. SR27]|uniref:SGNH/GDSL hydrolase family protein n=1 Tax=Streptomyces sp. SR27 TaxID=3076630 RepID=UPI00295B3D33|nr:SGNH/GDSL hydrolase family protein [Streptomyces sp. SR27]MDV9188049.1 GDSL-type esterase/lipase family protein [Streptomyces sp. SR27]
MAGILRDAPQDDASGPRILVLSDSTAAVNPKQHPLQGWGQALTELLVGHIEVLNFALYNASSRSFFTHPFIRVLNEARPGDIALISFGHNDQNMMEPDKYTSADEFRAYLELYAETLRELGVSPVFVTSLARGTFHADGQVSNGLRERADIMVKTASDVGVPLVDLNRWSEELWQDLGPMAAVRLLGWFEPGQHPEHPQGKRDWTHLNTRGAHATAAWLLAQLSDNDLLTADVIPQRAVDAVLTEDELGALKNAAAEQEAAHLRAESWLGQRPEPQRKRQWSWRAQPEPEPEPVAPRPVTITAPRAQAIVGPLVSLTGACPPDTDTLYFFVGTRCIGTTPPGPNGAWSWRRESGWPAGEHTLLVAAGRGKDLTNTATVEFVVVTHVEPPVITTPSDGSYTHPRPEFRGTAQKGVRAVHLLDDGVRVGESPVGADGQWSWSPPRTWSPGPRKIEAVAWVASNHSEPATVRIQVHGIPSGHLAEQLRRQADAPFTEGTHRPPLLISSQRTAPACDRLESSVDFPAADWAPITFTVPSSGAAYVTISAALHTTAGPSATVWALWQASGGYTPASPARGLSAHGPSRVYASRRHLLSGMKPGERVTITPQWNINAGTKAQVHFSGGQLLVEPA